MSDLRLDYLATDSVVEGIGASQILAYVERFADRGVDVHLHTFEKAEPGADIRERLHRRGVSWHPRPFGRFGAVGGVRRVAAGASAVRGAALVHARSDLAAASVLLARPRRWVWDVRSLFSDQRLALGTLVEGSPEHRALRRIERAAARSSDAVVTLTEAVLPVLAERHGHDVAAKATVVTTCVDTARFEVRPAPDPGTLQVLLAGTINRFYDVPAMVDLVRALRRRRPTTLQLVTPEPSPWDAELDAADPVRRSASPAEMPDIVAGCHVGLSVCRDDAGISLRGSMPTKLGEFLASGRPVVVNSLLGDASALVREHGVGVVVDDRSAAGIARAADELEAIVADPGVAARCRALAEEHFDLDRAADRLVALYRSLAG